MSNYNLQISLANIVLILDDLPHAKISRDRLRELIPDVEPEYVDLKPFIVVRYTDLLIEIILLHEQNRVEIKTQNSDDQTLKLVAKLAIQQLDAIHNIKIEAYGFNFFGKIQINDITDTRQFLIQQFGKPLEQIMQQIGGEIISISPQLNYIKSGLPHQLGMTPNPDGDNELAVHLNIHFDKNVIPTLNELEESFLRAKENFTDTISTIFRVWR